MKPIALALGILLLPFSQDVLAAKAQMRTSPLSEDSKKCQNLVKDCRESWEKARTSMTQDNYLACQTKCEEAMNECANKKDPKNPNFVSAQSHRRYCKNALSKPQERNK